MRFRLKSGLGLNYVTRGCGPTVALLHPVGLSHAVWAPLMAELEREFRLLAVDLRGHGDSDHDGAPFSLDDLAADVSELLRAQGGEPALVVGCSMGGMVAQGVALQAPELLAGVVVANASHMRSDKGRAVMEQRAQAAARGMPAVLEVTLSRWFDEAFEQAQPQTVAQVRDWLLAADASVHAAAWRAIRDLDFGDRLRDVACPALVVAGTRDRSVPPEIVRQVAAAFAHARYHEIDAGHLAPLEQPRAFADALRGFASGARPHA